MRPPDGTPVGLRNRPLLEPAVRGLNAWNARHPWSHNEHFHGWVLRHLPPHARTALDVGCGRGELLGRLAARVDHAVGVDPDAQMVAAARAPVPTAEVRQGSLLDVEERFDVVTAIASLHHLPFERALTHARDRVAPGGRLLVVGVAQLGSRTDVVWDAASLLLNPVVGFAMHPRPARAPRPGVPVRDPVETFDEVRAVVARVLPGARLRRRLFFRWTLRWDAAHGG